ncbi:hypothetical protein [Paractinoplanes atraurantiacus]|uniref:Uncharacterized protein n=1 Tax=Paractinoplanes atraurantiacus TaxID=1036182 RepID=A0A285F3S1_9ACTN|nr:hypothetical protein [Actinoplanes atraurantiacus]SNY05703.1 hypothetical protein SAMN05421748_101532 [Actinoplanes atraurantiacus]
MIEPPAAKTYTGEAADAHALAAQDVAEALDPAAPPRPASPAADLTPPETAAAIAPPIGAPAAPPAQGPIAPAEGPAQAAAAPVEGPAQAAAPVVASAAPPAEAVARFVAVERDHDRPDPNRYDPLRPPAGYTARTATNAAAGAMPAIDAATEKPGTAVTQQPSTAVTQQPGSAATPPPAVAAAGPPTAATGPAPATETRPSAPGTPQPATPAAETRQPAVEAAQPAAAAGEVTPPVTAAGPPHPGTVTPPPADQDVMVLPEPSARNRPTVPLEPGPVPARPPVVRRPRQGGAHARPTEPLPPLTGSPTTDARLERLENSPFWHDRVDDTIEVQPEAPRRSAGKPRHSRRSAGLPLSAQVSLVALGLVAAFFAWVSAEPFWLAVGHGDLGNATTTVCTGTGVTQRCAGQFTADDGSYTIARVTLLGVEGTGRQPGAVTPAKMVSPDSQQAYLGGTGALLQLRWLLGFALVLLCGYAIAGVTRARQLPSARARRGAILLSLAGPLALLAGFLAAAY